MHKETIMKSITEDGYCVKFDKDMHRIHIFLQTATTQKLTALIVWHQYVHISDQMKKHYLTDHFRDNAQNGIGKIKFMDGKTADQLNIEMVRYFVKKGLSDKLPEGMLEKYGGSNGR